MAVVKRASPVPGAAKALWPTSLWRDGQSERRPRASIRPSEWNTTTSRSAGLFKARFVGGKVNVEAFAFGFDGQKDDGAKASAVIRLKGGG
jgi:hypothetical protein